MKSITNRSDDKVTTVLSSKPFELRSKTIQSEQYNTFYYAEEDSDGFDGFDKVMNVLSPRIGECIIVYSELERTLESKIYELISDRSDQMGMLIARQMTYIQKVVLYIDLLRSINTEDEDYRKDVSLLKKHLVKVAELRNVIAHAKWPSITSDGYVFSAVEAINSEHGIPEMKYYKLNKQPLEKTFDYMSSVENMMHDLYEKHLER